MSDGKQRSLKVFLCHAKPDKPEVKRLYDKLSASGIDAWLDEEKLLPGQDWDYEIRKTVRGSDIIIICLSNKSITKEGYIQKEIRMALDIADEKPEGTIFLIPARLEECEVPARLSRWQWVDLFNEIDVQKLNQALQLRAKEVGAIPNQELAQIDGQANKSLITALEIGWDSGLTLQQKDAASHLGEHARLLAGPGTGKTWVLTRRIMFLIQEKGINPKEILALTFTRAAAFELEQRVSRELGKTNVPKISTLHAFALRQLIRNSPKIFALPQPLRIADDWEEKNIIFRDIKRIIKKENIKQIQELFNELSSDWETLTAEEQYTPDPRFIGAWQEHRNIFGYTLRSELVYQLKRSLEIVEDFSLEHPILHLLVDEYQDLNKCDLAVVKAITNNNVELFAAGDDDQSIYLFRKAHPDGIRNFQNDYEDAKDLKLSVCKRCDSEVLAIAEFVADLDTKRILKQTTPETGKPSGDVKLLRFPDQHSEARQIATLCKYFISKGVKPENILIVTRTDTNTAFSRELKQSFEDLDVEFSTGEKPKSIFDSDFGRLVLAFLRLARNPEDHLSWATLLKLRKNNKLGDKSLAEIYEFSQSKGLNFFQALQVLVEKNGNLPKIENKLEQEYLQIAKIVFDVKNFIEAAQNDLTEINTIIGNITNAILTSEAERETIMEVLNNILQANQTSSIDELINSIEIGDTQIEPEIEINKVNFLTMHRAKGLTADIVFILGAEDEHIPGKYEREPEVGDERRLLYVSLTRAKHQLYITYCSNRDGQQMNLGRSNGKSRRTLTRFLQNSKLRPEKGEVFVARKITE